MFQNHMLLIVIFVNSIMLNTLCIKKVTENKERNTFDSNTDIVRRAKASVSARITARLSTTASGRQHQYSHQV